MAKKIESRGRKDYAFEDATEPLTIHVTERDIKGAKAGSARNCVMARAVHREHGCFNIELHRTVAYVWWSENDQATRYQITRSSRDLMIAFDASGRSKPVEVTLKPPRGAISVKKFRTEEFRKTRKASYEKSKLRDRRAYSKPNPLTLWGVRNGTGASPGKSA